MKDLSRKVTLHCPLCGNDQFESLDVLTECLFDAEDDVCIKCSDCKSTFAKAQLIEENKSIINANIEDIKNDTMKEIQKEIKKAFKKLR